MQATSGNYTRNISFSDDSVNANTTVDRRLQPQQQQQQQQSLHRAPQQEQHGREEAYGLSAGGGGSNPSGPLRGILMNKDVAYRYGTQPRGLSGPGIGSSSSAASRTLPHHQQRRQETVGPARRVESPPLPQPPDVSPLERIGGDDTLAMRGKVVNFSLAGDSYQMTPLRAGASGGGGRQPQQSSALAGDRSNSSAASNSAGHGSSRAGESTVGAAYSLADMDSALATPTNHGLNRSNDLNTTGATADDEDRTTTTSGSYTINADDLCNEIDNLFFNDVVV
jgi:hypothetical protein